VWGTDGVAYVTAEHEPRGSENPQLSDKITTLYVRFEVLEEV
jgi:hypothetical protein